MMERIGELLARPAQLAKPETLEGRVEAIEHQVDGLEARVEWLEAHEKEGDHKPREDRGTS